jgi:hypothetical protein
MPSGSITVTPGIVWNNAATNDTRLNQAANPTGRVDAESITDRELQLAGLLTKLGNRLVNPNFIRNGNFELPFWEDGVSSLTSTTGADTKVAKYYFVNSTGAGVPYVPSTTSPATRSYYSLKLTGAASVAEVRVGQDLPAYIARMLKTYVVFSAYIRNDSGSAISPVLELSTPASVDDFTSVALRSSTTLQSCSNGAWTQVYTSIDVSAYTNIDNGLRVGFKLASGTLDVNTKFVYFATVKAEVGVDSDSVPTPFIYESEDVMQEFRAAGGRPGYTALALTNANQTWTPNHTKVHQDVSGTLSGAVTINILRTDAKEGYRFRVKLNVVVTASNTLTFQENTSGSLKAVVPTGTKTLVGDMVFVYSGTAWILWSDDSILT